MNNTQNIKLTKNEVIDLEKIPSPDQEQPSAKRRKIIQDISQQSLKEDNPIVLMNLGKHYIKVHKSLLDKNQFLPIGVAKKIEEYRKKQEIKLNNYALPNNFSLNDRFLILEQMTSSLPFTSKNIIGRYKDIKCPDETIVNVENKYLHGNYVQLGNYHNFICTQAPLPETENLFWQIAYEQAHFIMDLTKNNEDIKLYYPKNVGAVCINGDYKITCTEQAEVDNIKIHKYELLDMTYLVPQPKIFYRLNYENWPDHEALSPKEFIKLIHFFNEYAPEKQKELAENHANMSLPFDLLIHDYLPIIHCKAGVGRTGTLAVGIVLASMIDQKIITQKNYANMIDSLILTGRYQRGIYFVQSIKQYESLHLLAHTLLSQV
jgi:protein tyrosine phosphatase